MPAFGNFSNIGISCTRRKLRTFRLPSKEMFPYFVRKVTDFEEIWDLSDGTEWALLGDSNDNQLFPVWPEKDFAEICANGVWENYVPKSIP